MPILDMSISTTPSLITSASFIAFGVTTNRNKNSSKASSIFRQPFYFNYSKHSVEKHCIRKNILKQQQMLELRDFSTKGSAIALGELKES